MDSRVTPNEEPEGLNHWQYGDDVFPLIAHSRLLNTWKLLEAWLRILQLLALLGVLAWSALFLPKMLLSVHTSNLHRHTPALTNLHMAAIEAEDLDYQLVSPGNYRLNHVKRAIQTFKNHFIAILSGADPKFPKNCL